MNQVNSQPATRGRLGYLDGRTGRPVDADVVAVAGNGAELKLDTDEGTVEARLVRAGTADDVALDNEIIAGLRLHRLLAGHPHPAEVTRLIGFQAAGAEPFALVEPYRGSPCGAEAGRLLPHDLRRFQTSLLVGVRMLAAAGVAHRALAPQTVRWDGQRVQITGFAHAALVGEPRRAGGEPPWSAPEQRPERVAGDVTDRDDLWAVGRLILFMATGADGGRPDATDLPPDLERLLDGMFAAPANRPAVTELLGRLEAADPVVHGPEPDPGLVAGQREFYHVRQSKLPRTEPERHIEDEPEAKTPPAWRAWLARLGRVRPSPQSMWLGFSVAALLATVAYLIAR